MVAGVVPRIHWDDPSLEAYLRRAEPCIISGGCPYTRSLVGRWDFAHLAEHYGERSKVKTHFAPRHAHRFNRFYGRGLGEGGVTSRMTLKAFIEMASSNEAREAPSHRFYAQAQLAWWRPPGREDPNAPAGGGQVRVPPLVSSTGEIEHAEMDAALAAELDALDWPWLEKAMGAAEVEQFHSATLWAGYGGGCTPMHYDCASNFFTQLVGRKQVLLFSPEQWPCLYPYPAAHPMESYAMVDVERPDLERFPALRRARGLEAILEPGDVLWLPSFCYHHVRQLDEGQPNLSLNTWLGLTKQRVDLGSCVTLSPVNGGRARAMEEVQRRREVPPLTLQAHAGSLVASAAAAALGHASGGGRRGMTAADVDGAEEADEALLCGSHCLGLISLLMAIGLESKARAGLRSGESVGRFLNAMADGTDDGTDDGTAAGRSRRQTDAPPIGPKGSETYALAVKIRCELLAHCGVRGTCALLRLCTRHGRLHPGPPAVGSAAEGVINSEAKEETSEAIVAWVLAAG